MKKYEADILNRLIDKYEKSKSFTGKNSVNQSFSLKPPDIAKKYTDESEYDVYRDFNAAVTELQRLGFVEAAFQRNGVCTSVKLCADFIEKAYEYLGRTPKAMVNTKLRELLCRYKTKNEILDLYCSEQLSRLEDNKSVSFFDGNVSEFENVLKALSEILIVENETYQRDFSVRVLGDSKLFEKIKSKVISVLYEYGDFPEKETVLENLNIVRNPGHVFFKGNGQITINGQTINLSKIGGDIAISTSLLKKIERVDIFCDTVMTIENLTTFNTFRNSDVFVIYLGGYHNRDRREFIRSVHEQNNEKSFLHYGDIDAGGFYILQHLRRKTGVDFKPYNMNADTLKQYSDYTKPLTDNDRKRLQTLLNSEFKEVVKYMLKNNCKLEQEALDGE